MDVLSQALVEQKSLRDLQFVQVLQQCFELALKNFMKLVSLVFVIKFAELLNALNEKLKFFQNLFENLNILVINRLVQQIVETKPTSNDQHQTLVKLSCDVEQDFVVVH